MDAAVLLRLGPIFMSGIIVWPAMRLRGASIRWAAVGTIASAIGFGVIGAKCIKFSLCEYSIPSNTIKPFIYFFYFSHWLNSKMWLKKIIIYFL